MNEEIVNKIKHEYAHFKESGTADYGVILQALEEINRLHHELQKWKSATGAIVSTAVNEMGKFQSEAEKWKIAAISLRETIGHCFLPNEYSTTCEKCLTAVRFVDQNKQEES